MNIYKGKFELKTGESTDLQIYDPSILILFSPLNHNPSISIIPAQWNNTISALFEGIINLNSNIEGRICLLKKAILLQLSTIHKPPNSVIYEFLLILFRVIGKPYL